MSSHKFVVGQKVRFTADLGQMFTRGETFIVVRLLPDAQYHIQSEIDGHARVAREFQLADL